MAQLSSKILQIVTKDFLTLFAAEMTLDLGSWLSKPWLAGKLFPREQYENFLFTEY